MGLCVGSSQEILLATGLTPKQRSETFWHELLHAIEFEYEIKIPHSLIYELEKPLSYIFMKNAFIHWKC